MAEILQQGVTPIIPTTITVHLGSPNQIAPNETVSFVDYIKNVACSEIYPTWNPSALQANILAQISFALNRVYTEFYRSQGKDFDITNNTAIDQKFIYGRNFFENVSRMVDRIFDQYIRRIGNIEPLAAKYCNGTTVTCDGLSQWGSEALARTGASYLDILFNYYGRNIEIVTAPVEDVRPSFTGAPLRLGSEGRQVQQMQIMLNRISVAYPLIPKIATDGVFGSGTENAVKVFQGIFNLTPDGIVGQQTWYKMVYLYVGLKNLSELYSDGVRLFPLSLQYPSQSDSVVAQVLQYNGDLKLGQTGEKVRILQFYLKTISAFYQEIPPVFVTGVFDNQTQDAVREVQLFYGLGQTGEVNSELWDLIYDMYTGIVETVFGNEEYVIYAQPFAGQILSRGSDGAQVAILQNYLNYASAMLYGLPAIVEDGVFGLETENAVKIAQGLNDLEQTGVVDKQVWDIIADYYRSAVAQNYGFSYQFNGDSMQLGDVDESEVVL